MKGQVLGTVLLAAAAACSPDELAELQREIDHLRARVDRAETGWERCIEATKAFHQKADAGMSEELGWYGPVRGAWRPRPDMDDHI